MIRTLAIILLILLFSKCNENDAPGCLNQNFQDQFAPRNFKMGFTTWPFTATVDAVEGTYSFMESYTDMYSEHIDVPIPWSAWINNTPLPEDFVNSINYKVGKRLSGRPLIVSASFLNIIRDDIMEDVDGTKPAYQTLHDQHIREAYLKHVRYLIDRLTPDYFVFGMEVNEFAIKVPAKWEEYKTLAAFIRSNLKQTYPDLKVAESMTLHGWWNPPVPNPAAFIEEIDSYLLLSDFSAISFYPFLKGLRSRADFQNAFDFLHEHTSKPVAVVETNHIAEDLVIPAFNISIESDECEQNIYLETLLWNAQQHQYLFVIWWAHRDYDLLWETFPPETKDLGRLWRDTGVLDGSGGERISFETWKAVLGN